MTTPAADEPTPGRLESAWSGLAVLLGIVLLQLDLPWALGAAVPAVAGLVLSLRAARLRLRAGQRGSAAWAALGAVLALYVLGMTVVYGVLYGSIDEYRRCTSSANTQVARARCDATLLDAENPAVRLLG